MRSPDNRTEAFDYPKTALPMNWRVVHASEIAAQFRDSKRMSAAWRSVSVLAKTDLQLKGGAEHATAEMRVSRRASWLERTILRAQSELAPVN
jgi:hypothetical protein